MRSEPAKAGTPNGKPGNDAGLIMDFRIIGEVTNVEIIAIGAKIRILPYLQQEFGRGRWRKLKGTAHIKLGNGDVRLAELHWFEAHGIGKKFLRIKRYLD